MNKYIYLLLGALAGVVIVLFAPRGTAPGVGISLSEPSYASSSVTEGTVACGSAASNGTGTLIVAAAPGRIAFGANNTAALPVVLCRRSNGCTATGTIQLNASGTVGSSFEQTDAYIGPYSCVGINATTTISYGQAL